MMQFCKKHPYIVLLVISLFFFLIGNDLAAVTDTAESNYAETAKEMVLTGNWISPQIYGRYWYDKPIFYYWELALSYKLFGFNEFASRLPSALLGTAGVLFTYWFVRKAINSRTAFLSSLILGSCLEFFILSKAVVTDATLFLFMSAALAFFYLGYTENKKYYFLCYVFAALGVLTKGPIGLILPGGAAFLFLCWKRNLKELLHVHLFSGLILFLLITASWYGTMCWLHGSDFLLNFIGVHNVLRATLAEHPSKNTWYFYIIIFFAGFAPWSFTYPYILYKKIKEHSLSFRKTTGLNQLLIIYALFVFLFFEIVATKYTTYVFPAFFSLAILTAEFYDSHAAAIAKTALASLVILGGITLFAAPSIMVEHSGKEAGLAAASIAGNDRPVCYYRSYRTSAVFYSGIFINRAEPADEIDSMKPGGLSWKAKNVMPMITIEEAEADPRSVFIVKKQDTKDFLESLQKNAPDRKLTKQTVSKTENIWY